MHIVLVGMNHRTAEVDLREKCALDRERTCQALGRLRREHGLTEAVILSTCRAGGTSGTAERIPGGSRGDEPRGVEAKSLLPF
jgi:glutamyl-tRNA reductase